MDLKKKKVNIEILRYSLCLAPSLNMLTHSAFFPLPRTKANILLDLIRVSSFSGSSFARKQNEVFYNTEDHTALLFSSFDFNCPFFFFFPSLFSPSHSSCTSAFVSGRLCLDVMHTQGRWWGRW